MSEEFELIDDPPAERAPSPAATGGADPAPADPAPAPADLAPTGSTQPGGGPGAAARPPRGPLRVAVEGLASLKLTVALLALAMALVFFGTLAQVDMGIWQVQQVYFRSFLVAAPVGPVALPLPGGYLLGGALLANLLAAHALRFRVTRKKLGILLIHGSLILLLVGELLTGLYAVESNMEIDEGATVDFSYDIREVELAVVDPSPAGHDLEVIVPQSHLEREATITHPELPFRLQVLDWLPNSTLVQSGPDDPPERQLRLPGAPMTFAVQPLARSAGTEGGVDAPSAVVALTAPDGQDLGRFPLSLHTREPRPVEVGGKRWLVQLRFRRYYKPYSLHLLDFAHDRYTGTNVPMNFSSRLRLKDAERGEDREVLIYMNNPLRHRGETLYQASFKNDDRTTVLQVVNNPAYALPYIACLVGALGLTIHFGANLLRFLRRTL